ncbi:MAG: hypothetical protein KGL35_03280 [Bradyrhizobium sp.]|nr:hypothetical protein [Bradyrhizobium sp.]
MTWSYNPATLATVKKDQVRLLIGDTASPDPLMQDEEINFLISLRNSIYGAAAECCRSLAAQFARQADSTQGSMHTTYSSKSRAYASRAAQYENMAISRSGALPFAGGISIADKQQTEADSDRVPPQFNIGMDDNPLPVGPAGNETMDYPTGGVG